MKKSMRLILIFIIGLTFNTASYAGIFAAINWIFEGNYYRCTATYSRDNLINTQLETKKNTTQFVAPYFYKDYDYCAKGVKNLAKKIKKWLKKDKNNIVLDFDKPLRCKERWADYVVARTWSQVYTPCAEKYNQQLLDLLTDKYPDQIKTTFIKKQMYADASDGTHNLLYEGRCSIENVQLDLMTGSETIYKNTAQFESKEYCEKGTERLAEKLIKQANKNHTNVIADMGVVRCKLKNYFKIYHLTGRWGKYADCPAEYSRQLADDLVAEIPTQIGQKIRRYEFKPTPYD